MKKIKRYLIFAYGQYYPSGGWSDFKESYDSLEDAQTAFSQMLKDSELVPAYNRCEYGEIVDSETGEYVDRRDPYE